MEYAQIYRTTPIPSTVLHSTVPVPNDSHCPVSFRILHPDCSTEARTRTPALFRSVSVPSTQSIDIHRDTVPSRYRRLPLSRVDGVCRGRRMRNECRSHLKCTPIILEIVFSFGSHSVSNCVCTLFFCVS